MSPENDHPVDVTELSPDEQVMACFRGTCELSGLAEQRVLPVVVAQVGKSDQEQVVVATYYRMCLLVRGLAKLDDPNHGA